MRYARKIFLVLVALVLMQSYAAAECEYFSPKVYQFVDAPLRFSETAIIAYEDEHYDDYVQGKIFLVNETDERREFLGGTVLWANMQEVERVANLEWESAQLEMIRRYWQGEVRSTWFKRVEVITNAPSCFIDPGETLTIKFEMKAHCPDYNDVVLLFQEYSIPAP